jgi:VWFA-related protein
MRAFPQRLYLVLIFGIAANVQFSAQGQSPSTQIQKHQEKDESVSSSGITLTTGTQLVVVDVTVQDKDGRPIHGLKPSDFQITEGNTPQPIKSFDEHVAVDPKTVKPPAVVKLAPGNFTDYTPVPENTPLTVILFDRLNTQVSDQPYVISQLRKFLLTAKPDMHVAVFGLTTKLLMLQGFTSDPTVLRNAIEGSLSADASPVLANPVGNGTGPDPLSQAESDAGAPAQSVANLKEIETESLDHLTELRVRYTLNAFSQLGTYLAGFPGRKNLIWFSGSFPLSILADPTIQKPFEVANGFEDQFKQTTALLARARVAVYPVEAGGLQVDPSLQASQDGRAYLGGTAGMNRTIESFGTSLSESHNTMKALATDTGGHAFYNTNGLAEAVTESFNSGSNYYTLTYSPSNRDEKAGYRQVHIRLVGDATAHNPQLSYRHSYYKESPGAAHTAKLADSTAGAKETPAHAYALAIMQHGAPAPSEILFKVRVLPVSSDKHLTDPPTLKGASQLYDIDFTALATKLDIPLQPDGHRHGAVEFVTFAYDADGKLLNSQSQTMRLNLTPENYAQLLKGGIGFSQQIGAPARTRSFRIAVHDLSSGHLGVVEVPLASVSHLAPAP